MRRILRSAALVALASIGSAKIAAAGSYLFERSYYSHEPATPVVIGHRAPLGGPQFTRPQGFGVQSSWRWQFIPTRVGGQTVEQLNVWDGWVQFYGKQ